MCYVFFIISERFLQFVLCLLMVFTTVFNVFLQFLCISLWVAFSRGIRNYETIVANTQRGRTHERSWHRHDFAAITHDVRRHVSFCPMLIADGSVDAFTFRVQDGDLYVRNSRSPRLTWRAAMLRHCAHDLLTLHRYKHTALHARLKA